MKQPTNNRKPVEFSQRIFARLLAAYPRAHREAYGREMAQVFRDQCEEAWGKSGWAGLVGLWLRVLPDILKSSLLEHCTNLKGRKNMMRKLLGEMSSPIPLVAFFAVFILAFLGVVIPSTIIAFVTPEAYSSKAIFKVERADLQTPGATDQTSSGNQHGQYDPYFLQTQAAIIQSDAILDTVIDQLKLNDAWSKKFSSETKFKNADSRQALKRMIQVQPEHGTALISVLVYSDDSQEAAQIANATAETYAQFRNQAHKERVEQDLRNVGITPNAMIDLSEINAVQIIEHAEPSARAVRPNKPLNIAIGVVVGAALGTVAGGIAALAVAVLRRNRMKNPPVIS